MPLAGKNSGDWLPAVNVAMPRAAEVNFGALDIDELNRHASARRAACEPGLLVKIWAYPLRVRVGTVTISLRWYETGCGLE